jgi:hypothetical protein
LICLASEDDAFALTRTAGDVEFEDILGLDDLVTLALLTALLLGDD